jgi:DNA helicase-2/ATP-dependent DNA helicase PcrA
MGLPVPAHHALAYGTAMHHAVAAFHVSQTRHTPLTEEQLLAEFERSWTAEGFLSREHEDARYLAGQNALRRFRAGQLAVGAVPPVAVERPFAFRLGADLVRGRMDRIDAGPDGVVITDYKTSDVHDQRRADAKARDSLQLDVYALAHEAETGTLPREMRLHFLDTGLVGHTKPDGERLEKSRQKLSQAADSIRAGRFDPKPNPVACGYCPYRTICAASAA